MNKKLLSLILAPFILAGCAGMNGNFDCPLGSATSCKSLDQVNSMIDQGNFNTSTGQASSTINTAPLQNAPFRVGDPIWIPATIVQISILPYFDSNNIYHQSIETLFVTAKPKHWLGSPPKVVVPQDNSDGWVPPENNT